MKIIKRNGSSQNFNPNKIYNRIKDQAKGLSGINVDEVFKKVMPTIQDGLTTTQIDENIAFTLADMVIKHPNYSVLGGRILMTRQAKILNTNPEPVDLTYDFFSAYTFLQKYSLKNEKEQPTELPSMMYRRIANYLGIDEVEKELFYVELSSKKINASTPISTNAGSGMRNALISCNLTTNIGDDTDSILETLSNISLASREGAGIGLLIDNIRSDESIVNSFKGKAGGVVRYADMVQSHMRFFKQGSRSGSAALYLSVWHKDILKFLELTLNTGDEQNRTRDLFTAVNLHDNFMKALINGDDWYVFCPNDILKAGLTPFQDLWGEEFEAEYSKAVELGIGTKVSPKVIWDSMLKSQVDNGRPYVLHKDNANIKNMQKNIGTISQSNLCNEVIQVSKPNYTPQCALLSINLAEHDSLESIAKSTRIGTRMLNRVIDNNVWSDEASAAAGEDQRALAIGVAGMADFFAKKKVSFESEEASIWNELITKTMYTNAVQESYEMALAEGCYPAWEGSPYSEGTTYVDGFVPEGVKIGDPIPMRNSLLLGFMPTASSAILSGCFESFQPPDSNMFSRKVGQGEFLIVNKYLVRELEELGIWNDEMVNAIIRNNGSVQGIPLIPEDVQFRYKTVWEIPQKTLIDLAVVRNAYIDQSQSMNLYFADAKYGKISAALKYGWEKGLKTGVYYTRTKSKLEASAKLAGAAELPQKPKDSPFDCFNCSA